MLSSGRRSCPRGCALPEQAEPGAEVAVRVEPAGHAPACWRSMMPGWSTKARFPSLASRLYDAIRAGQHRSESRRWRRCPCCRGVGNPWGRICRSIVGVDDEIGTDVWPPVGVSCSACHRRSRAPPRVGSRSARGHAQHGRSGRRDLSQVGDGDLCRRTQPRGFSGGGLPGACLPSTVRRADCTAGRPDWRLALPGTWSPAWTCWS